MKIEQIIETSKKRISETQVIFKYLVNLQKLLKKENKNGKQKIATIAKQIVQSMIQLSLTVALLKSVVDSSFFAKRKYKKLCKNVAEKLKANYTKSEV